MLGWDGVFHALPCPAFGVGNFVHGSGTGSRRPLPFVL